MELTYEKSKRSIMGNLIMISCGLMLMLVINITAGVIIQYDQTAKNVKSMLTESLDSGSHMAESGIENLFTVIGEHVGDYEFINGTSEEKTAHAAILSSYDSSVLAVTYIDPDGTAYGEAVPSSVTSGLRSSSATMTAPSSMDSDFYMGVKGASGGILVYRMKADKLSAVISGGGNDMFILAPDGTVVAASSKNGSHDAKYAKYVQSSGTAVYANPAKQGDSYYCYSARAIEGTSGWTLLIRVNSGEYYNGLAMAVIIDIFVIVAMAFLGVMAIIFMKRRIVNPLNKVRAKIVDMSRGNLSGDRIEIRSENELGELANSVNGLSDINKGIIDDIHYTAEQIANENLCVQPKAQYMGDFLPVKNSLESIVSSMKEVVSNVDAAGRQVSASSAQMSSNSAALSQAAVEETATVAELNDSLSSVHSQINESAKKAARAREVVEESVSSMNEGNEKMTSMLKAMTYINDTSSEIAVIIKTIQDIAFQTNILSLNAAIEAARAGEAGKGFAVVAEEVSLLASKAAEASKNTTELIENSVKAVEHGTVIANEAAKMLADIVERSKESETIVEEIADDANRQAESINRVMEGMNRISASVNQVNISASECADSSQMLATQSAMLQETVDRFIIDPSSAPKAARPAPKPKPVSEPATASKPASEPAPKSEPKYESKPEPRPEPKYEPKPAPKYEPKPEPKYEPKPMTQTAPRTTQKSKTISLPGDELASKPAAPAPKPAAAPKPTTPAKPAATPKPAASPMSSAAPKPAASPMSAAPKPAASPKPSPKPVIKSDDDAVITNTAPSNVVSRATMQPIKYTVRMDSDKY